MILLTIRKYALPFFALIFWTTHSLAKIDYGTNLYDEYTSSTHESQLNYYEVNFRAAVLENTLGLMSLKGEGTDKDLTKAYEWFNKAANRGLPESKHNLGLMYANGYGVKKDIAKAYNWFHKAALLGNVKAMATIATFHIDEINDKKNLALAHVWFDLAGKHGLEGAHKHRDNIALLLPQEYINKAQEVANNWIIGQEIPNIIFEY
jgi:TPR repeat protein